MGTFFAFACPDGGALEVPSDLVVASSERSGMAHQNALRRYLDDVRPRLPQPGPEEMQAIRLDVGLPENSALMAVRELDNWLYPLARRLDTGQIASAWATKRFARRSRMWVEPARRVETPAGGHELSINASYLTPGYRDTIASQLARQGASVVAPGEPLSVQISFVVGPHRNWLNLWRPTVDALALLLGDGPKRGTAQDGRITSLGLHRRIEPELWNEVLLKVDVVPAAPVVPDQVVNPARLASGVPPRQPASP